MLRKPIFMALLLALALAVAGCRTNNSVNPIANVDSKQPDKVLFDRAMDALKHNKFDVARITLQTLINTYPDSEYVARAKLSIGDAWYQEGTSAALAQAEIEYKDFITFFPNMPEAAEAQMKVANIHFRQMEKPDRDFTHAMRAEDEYREMILQFPDSPLVPQAKQRLLQVQEVLAEREYRIGRFYYLRQAWPAAIARLKSLADNYPLYSQADQALLLLGDSYQGEAENVRAAKLPETKKAELIEKFTKEAAAAYQKILTRYPVMEAATEARQRLEDLHLPAPQATPEAIAQNKAEEASRGETGRLGRVWNNFKHGPDTASSTKVGDPTLTDAQPTNATAIVRDVMNTLKSGSAGDNSATVETNKDVKPGPNQPAPRSDTDSNPPKEEQPAPMPQQVNEANQDKSAESSSTSSSATSDAKDPKDKKQEESSSKKKKKGLFRKLIPF